MVDLAAQASWLRDRAVAILRRYARARRWIQIVFVLGGAFVSGVAASIAKMLGPPHDSWLYAMAIVASVAAFLVSAVFLVVDEGALEAVSRALEAIQEADRRGGELASLALEFEWIARLNATSRALRDYLQSVLADGEALRQGPESHLRRMLDLVLAEKHVLFGVGDEQWNFAVYLHDPVGDVLTCRVCRRPLREEEEAAHRDWKPGEGHVGMAWQRGEELIASDSTDPQVEPFFRAPGAKFRNDDARRYRSIASVPIVMAGARPLGVLVATSDRMGRFVPKAVGSIDHVEPLRLLSSALAMMLHVAQLYEGKESGV